MRRGDTYSSGFLDLQLPKVEWSSQYFWPISLMLIICLTEGCLKHCLLRLSVSYTWDNMPAIWESWWSEMPAWDLCHISLPPIFPVALIFQRSNKDLNAIKSPDLQKAELRFNSLDIRGPQIKRYCHPPDTQALHQDHGENNYCSPCSILFQGLSLITVLHPPPCHTRMGTVKGQMATDGESEVPLQI